VASVRVRAEPRTSGTVVLLALPALLLPAIAFAWLVGHPVNDATVRVPLQHFYVVTAVSVLAFALAILLAIAAMQYRVLFL